MPLYKFLITSSTSPALISMVHKLPAIWYANIQSYHPTSKDLKEQL